MKLIISIVCTLIWTSIALGGMQCPRNQVIGSSGSGTCQDSTQTCSSSDDFWYANCTDGSSRQYLTQKIKITASTQICGISAELYDTSGSDVVIAQVFDAANSAQIGSDSGSKTLGSAAGAMVTFTFASPITVTSDVTIRLVRTSGTQPIVARSRTSSTCYETSSYDMGCTGGGATGNDLHFVLRTIQ